MRIKERFQREITMTVLQRQCMLIVTMLGTLGLVTNWPRFHDDAMSAAWWVYLVLISIFMIPLVKKN